MIDFSKSYRNIYVLESRDDWKNISNDFDVDADLILTFDFGLRHFIEGIGGHCNYIDAICSSDEMERNNFLAIDFLKKWHFQKNGKDIFTAFEVSFGFAFRIEIWSELFYYIRIRANLEKIRNIKYKNIYIPRSEDMIWDIASEMGLSFAMLRNFEHEEVHATYFFNIHKYIEDALHKKSIIRTLKSAYSFFMSEKQMFLDVLSRKNKIKKGIYLQLYYPTFKIAKSLVRNKNLRVVTASPFTRGRGIRKFLIERMVPIKYFSEKYKNIEISLLENFKKKCHFRMILDDGTDITSGSYKTIEAIVRQQLPKVICILKGTVDYFEKLPISLEIMIANVGVAPTIADCVLRKKGVPSFLIINGLLVSKFLDEGKYATHINCYGEEIKRHYFKGKNNIICLGDPRMDTYCNASYPKLIDRIKPTIGIGTSGFNNINLISHQAIEFDFLFDVLTCFDDLRRQGEQFHIIVKVRANGDLEQYKLFVGEYFQELDIDIVQDAPILEILKKIDLYISIYSQTLFEASCMGIPVIYYKKDSEFLYPPFDSNSELVTADKVEDLRKAFLSFKHNDAIFDKFLDKRTMERFLGPLDGKNLERNIDYIYNLIGMK